MVSIARMLAAAAGIIFIGFIPALPEIDETSIILTGVSVNTLNLSVVVFAVIFAVIAVCVYARLYLRKDFLYVKNILTISVAFGFGAGWGLLYGYNILANELPSSLVDRELIITGSVSGLPRKEAYGIRFELRLSAAGRGLREGESSYRLPKKIMLSWYHPPMSVRIRPGDIWQLKVRLKPPRGFINPAGFDYKGWLLQRGIGATGYVRADSANRRLGESVLYFHERWRYQVQQSLNALASSTQQMGILKALAIGDRSDLSAQAWKLFQSTGTVHLMAISGLHIGLAAGLGYLIGLSFCRMLILLCPERAVMAWLAPSISVWVAFVYAALAGFSLPTQRAFVMVLVVNIALWRARPLKHWHSWSLALLAVLLMSPLAGHDAGFWLSFCAVAVLLMMFNGKRFVVPRRKATFSAVYTNLIARMLLSQWAVCLGLILPLWVWGMPVAWVSPLANLIAIPLVSWLVVPFLLGALALLPVLPKLAILLLHWADACAGWTLAYLQFCDNLSVRWDWFAYFPASQQAATSQVVSMMIFAFAGVLFLLSPRGLPGRWLGVLCWGAFIFPRQIPLPPLMVTVLDVGQGLAVVVRTQTHTLLFDSGPRYSEKFDAGSGVIAPFLRSQGIQQIDKLIVSHGDGDHRGGLQGILSALPVKELYIEQSKHLGIGSQRLSVSENQAGIKSMRCVAGMQWQWEGVNFQILSPPLTVYASKNAVRRNNKSCVLLVSYASQAILLPGDIEAEVEHWLLKNTTLPARLTMIIAPHHGSLTSSSESFVEHLSPRFTVISAGFHNRYGHPHPLVVQRYQKEGSLVYNTALNGAVKFIWTGPDELYIRRQRCLLQRYWFTEFTHC